MTLRRVIIVGGGAAGFFAAIACAEASPETEVVVLEKGARFLDKVRISGGGRCNVTHACFAPREFVTRYPRGAKALLTPIQRFSASDTVAWFAARGVKLKTESDGRMFPVTDSSQTIVDCLINAARAAGVKLRLNAEVESVRRREAGGFEVEIRTDRFQGSNQNPHLSPADEQERQSPTRLVVGRTQKHAGSETGAPPSSEMLVCDGLLLATGGCRAAIGGQLAVKLGHTLEAPVSSLFTFHVELPWLRGLAGITVEEVEVEISKDSNTQIPKTPRHPTLRERGTLLITHWGVSGPVVLRMSAWGARVLHGLNYQFPLLVNWLPRRSVEEISMELDARRRSQPAKLIVNTTIAPLPLRLWEQLVGAAGISRETRWSALSRAAQHQLTQQLTRTELPVTGKSLNKDEFVTCGGVRLNEVNFKTMESRICPGLYFAGELLDVDGITGGFNFQAAWTTGWVAGQALAGRG